MIAQPRRHWLQFGLGTLFVVMAVLATFLAYHANWIRKRHQALHSPEVYAPDGQDWPTMPQAPVAPGLLWIYGEPGYSALGLFFGKEYSTFFQTRRDLTPDEQSKVNQIKHLFPEAKVEAYAFDPPQADQPAPQP